MGADPESVASKSFASHPRRIRKPGGVRGKVLRENRRVSLLSRGLA